MFRRAIGQGTRASCRRLRWGKAEEGVTPLCILTDSHQQGGIGDASMQDMTPQLYV